VNMGINEILNSLIIWTNVDIVKLAHATGISRATIHNILAGKVKRVRNRTAERLADYFGITVAQLKGEETLPESSLTPHVAKITLERDLLAQVPFFIGEETARILDDKYPEEPNMRARDIGDPIRQESLRIKYYLWLLSLKAAAE
jgi:transcriptional regulator with XRE-family HTH domain